MNRQSRQNPHLLARNTSIVCFLGVALGLVLGASRGSASAVDDPRSMRRPNILLVMTDDQGYGDLGLHGNPILETPVLDRFAVQGARFDRFYVSPVCAPTRASLLTGRDHLRTGTWWVTRGYETMRADELTIAESLRDAGYATGIFGKWHNGAHWPETPQAQGFDEFLGFCAGHWNNYFDTTLQHNGAPEPTEGYISDALTDAAIEFIDEHREKPFFCYIPYNAPHAPFQVPDDVYDKYLAKGLDPKLASIYGMCENLDTNFGRLLDALETRGLVDETIVLFLTDNGPNSDRYNAGMLGRKGSVHEGGVRVPLLVRYPGVIPEGLVVEPIAQHIDLLPTLLEFAEVERPTEAPTLDGRSLVPLLTDLGAADDWTDRVLFTHQSRGGRVEVTPIAARTQRWRLVNTGRGDQLFDMQADPGQMSDVADEHPEVVERLRRAYQDWFAEVQTSASEPLPITIDERGGSTVRLPGHEADLGDGVRYFGRSGWAHDWITGWDEPGESFSWSLDVVTPGRYRVALLYRGDPENVGSTFQIRFNDESLTAVIDSAFASEPIRRPERVPRTEVYEHDWGRQDCGVLELTTGRGSLTVRAEEVQGDRVADVKGVELRRIP